MAYLPTSNFPAFREIVGTNFTFTALSFSDTIEQTCYFIFSATNFGSGSVGVKFKWYAETAVSGNIVWGSSLACITPNTDNLDILSKSFAAEQTITDSHLASTGRRLHEITLPLTNLDGLASGDLCVVRIRRKAADINDTMSGNALLIGVDVEYSNV
jgi:hypothetical protein